MKKIQLTALLFTLCLIPSYGIYAATKVQQPVQQSDATVTTATDAQITKQIRQKYNSNKIVSDLKTNVVTNNGVVTLTGEVNTSREASTLVELAQSVQGVRNVNATGLKVKESKQLLADTYITAKVKGLFLRAKLFGGKDVAVTSINVDTKNGVVYLSGTAKSQQQINNAVQLAKSIQGVTSVDNKVQISND